jgi:hypothetical protein
VSGAHHLPNVEGIDREPVRVPHVIRHLLDGVRLVARLDFVPTVGETADAVEGF